MSRDVSPLEAARAGYDPRLPEILAEPIGKIAIEEGAATTAASDEQEIARRFPRTYGRPLLRVVRGRGAEPGRPLRVGVVLSGGQAPGGHNVITGLWDGLQAVHAGSGLVGFLAGPRGIFEGDYRELGADALAPFRNTGGFDLIGSGRDKIESDEQLLRSRRKGGK